ncbi:MAG: pyridine nucleotide-disulfide oxidoreductase [Proteobacteria bacterium]|nr:pyridine nucleotide-disulfide oxidoreductase [Pseudomonadota bacterium]
MSSDSALAGSVSVTRARRRFDDGPIALVIFVICVVGVLYLAWQHRGESWLDPRHGWGYPLGIVGGSMMLALLLYPLRKRAKSMRTLGSVATWFRLHMILGIVGPVLVVVHSNFEIKSLNAAVALYSMLIVSGSGIVGRYFYGRIHRGLYGSKVEARELIAEAQGFRRDMDVDVRAAAQNVVLAALEREAMTQSRGFFSAVAHAVSLNVHAARSERELIADCDRELESWASQERWPARVRSRRIAEAHRKIRRYHDAVRRVGSLAVYERLFSAWHVLHLPLFFMLILTALIHVVAVHLY